MQSGPRVGDPALARRRGRRPNCGYNAGPHLRVRRSRVRLPSRVIECSSIRGWPELVQHEISDKILKFEENWPFIFMLALVARTGLPVRTVGLRWAATPELRVSRRDETYFGWHS